MIKIHIIKIEELQKYDFFELASALPFGDAERTRLAAIGNSKHKWESLGGLVALSRLAHKFGADTPLDISRSASGKPYFAKQGAPQFSISHSHGIAAAAMGDAECSRIGFDIEVIDEVYDFIPVVERFFTDAEKQRFSQKGGTAEAFFTLWTVKEALAKLDGDGLSKLLADKEKKDSADISISSLTVSIGEKKAVMTVCTYGDRPTIEIYTDNED